MMYWLLFVFTQWDLCIHNSGDILRHTGRGGDCIWPERDWCHTSSYQRGTAGDQTESELIPYSTSPEPLILGEMIKPE